MVKYVMTIMQKLWIVQKYTWFLVFCFYFVVKYDPGIFCKNLLLMSPSKYVSSHGVLLIAPLECRSRDKRDFYLLFDLPIHSSRFSGTSGRDRQDEREGRLRIITLSEIWIHVKWVFILCGSLALSVAFLFLCNNFRFLPMLFMLILMHFIF